MSVTEKYNERRQYKRDMSHMTYQMRKRSGICTRCGKEIDDKSTSLIICSSCYEYIKKYRELPEKRARRKEREKRQSDLNFAFGVCVRCGKHDALKGKKICGFCVNDNHNAYVASRERKGIIPRHILGRGKYCNTCAKPVEVEGNKLCNTCYEKTTARLDTYRDKALAAKKRSMKFYGR